MQRVPLVLIFALILVVFYYYEPLRNTLFPAKKPSQTEVSPAEPAKKDEPVDKQEIEVYALGLKLDNLQGRVMILKIAQENRDWFSAEEYSQALRMLTKAEEELKQTETEYEKIKNEYIRETVVNMVKESLEKEPPNNLETLPY